MDCVAVVTKEEKFDASAMHARAQKEPVKLVDDGSGKVEVFCQFTCFVFVLLVRFLCV